MAIKVSVRARSRIHLIAVLLAFGASHFSHDRPLET